MSCKVVLKLCDVTIQMFFSNGIIFFCVLKSDIWIFCLILSLATSGCERINSCLATCVHL